MGKGGRAQHSNSQFPAMTVNIDFPSLKPIATMNMDSKSMLGRLKITSFLSFWFVFSVASLFVAKHVLHVYKLNEAIFSLWQFALSVTFGLTFTKIFRFHPLATLTSSQLHSIVPLSTTFLIKELLKYAALSRVSVNLVNTIRSLGPLFNVILEYLCLGYRPQPKVLYALTPIIIGVTLTSFDEFHVASISDSLLIAVVGCVAAILSTAINIGQNMYSKILFGRDKIDPVSLQIYLSAISFVIMSPFTCIQLFYQSLREGRLSHEFAIPPRPVITALVAAGFINFLASQFAFNTLNLISPLSYSVANTFKRVAIAVIAIFYFNERLSTVNGIGIVISIVGIFIYERQSRSQKEAHQYKIVSDSDDSTTPSTTTHDLMKRTDSGPDLRSLEMESNGLTSSTPAKGDNVSGTTGLGASGDAVQRHFYVDLASNSPMPKRQTSEMGHTRV